ncbi:hypothetical protein AURDEDRAFT_164632 [Auricularia subglabra TFB-10046 SS5]|nr:hypothetical protein AURDEDRAFT_164632 [Auricularia subglabra TFB-10046 SS5]
MRFGPPPAPGRARAAAAPPPPRGPASAADAPPPTTIRARFLCLPPDNDSFAPAGARHAARGCGALGLSAAFHEVLRLPPPLSSKRPAYLAPAADGSNGG